jgi:hypothetical protein
MISAEGFCLFCTEYVKNVIFDLNRDTGKERVAQLTQFAFDVYHVSGYFHLQIGAQFDRGFSNA